MSHASAFAQLPKPPYYAVIFSSRRNGRDEPGDTEAADRLFARVQQQPGFLGAESTRGADGFGITVAYFDTEASIRAWRDHDEHVAARARGRADWYEHFELRIARVERAYGA